MKILLINPPFERLKGIGNIYFPLGPGYIGAVAKLKKCEVMLYNAELPSASEKVSYHLSYKEALNGHFRYTAALKNKEHYLWKEVYKVVSEYRPDVAGITVMTAKYGSALKVSKIIKEAKKDCLICWGGPHPTILPDEVMQNEEVDFVIKGEGELTMSELIDDLERGNYSSLDDIYGLSYRKNSHIFHNPKRDLIEKLDTVPNPLKEKRYLVFPERFRTSVFGSLITARGCPFRCGYCGSHNLWTRKVRYRSLDKVMSEIKEIISNYKTHEIYFWDDSFTLDRNRIIQLCLLILEERLNINWGCTTRVDHIDEGLLTAMKESGCDYISLGIESGSKRILENIKKDITLEQVKRAVELLKKYGIRYELFFMFGFPEETREDINQTFELMKELKQGSICLSIFTPYPGTEQFEIAKNHGLIPQHIDWSDYSHQSPENHFVKYVSKDEFTKSIHNLASWIDARNAQGLNIRLLLNHTIKDIFSVIKKPQLIVNKLNTLRSILSRKLQYRLNRE